MLLLLHLNKFQSQKFKLIFEVAVKKVRFESVYFPGKNTVMHTLSSDVAGRLIVFFASQFFEVYRI